MDITPRELTLLNFYRASEIYGGLVLGRLAMRVRDADLIARLTTHAAEEVHHGQMWTETIIAVGGRPWPTRDTYQSRYAAAIGAPSTTLEVLALTQVFERGVYRHFMQHLRRPGTHPLVRATLAQMLDEERGHLSWVKRWLDAQTGVSAQRAASLMRRYAAVDVVIRAQLLRDYEWDAIREAA